MFRPLICFVLAGLFLFPSLALAAEPGSLFLPALALDFVADRARMIQISLIAVAIGIAILWWKR
jgi:hypothetical protein